MHSTRRLLSSSVRDRVFEKSVLSGFQKSNCAPLPPTYKFDADQYKSIPPTEVTVLPSGMRVATETTPSETATIGVYISSGSRYESTKTNGAAHFLEHISFKGTGKRTQAVLESEMENLGGQLNAYTARESTMYYARVLKKDVGKAVDILSDILLNSEMSASAIEAERGVILREMEEVHKVEEEVVMDLLHETCFVNSSLSRPILGPVENISSLSRDDLQTYIKANYTAPRFQLIGAGGVSHSELVALGEKHFSSLRTAPEVAPEPVDKSVFVGSYLGHRDDSKPLTHFALAFEGKEWGSGDSFAQMLMQTLLNNYSKHSAAGRNSSSPMCAQIAQYGLAESVSSFNSIYSDTSLFGTYAICEPDKVQDLCWVILREMVNLCHNVSDADVARAQNQLKTAFLLQTDDSTSIVDEIGRQLAAYGRRMSIAETFARIDAVDAATVRRVATDIINDRDLAVAAYGPLFDFPDYNWLRRRTYMLRY